jgi:hypothetical protein
MAEEGGQDPAPVVSKSKKYRKDKPWDNESIDHWRIEPFKPEELTAPLLEESSFATLFPKYREKYLRVKSSYASSYSSRRFGHKLSKSWISME